MNRSFLYYPPHQTDSKALARVPFFFSKQSKRLGCHAINLPSHHSLHFPISLRSRLTLRHTCLFVAVLLPFARPFTLRYSVILRRLSTSHYIPFFATHMQALCAHNKYRRQYHEKFTYFWHYAWNSHCYRSLLQYVTQFHQKS